MAEPWLSGDDCPEVERHTSVPSGYVARAEDAERRLAAGEVQRQCPACGLWAIWDVPSAQALSEATVEQLRAELARRDVDAALAVCDEVLAMPDWHAALIAAGLERTDSTGWRWFRLWQIKMVEGRWHAVGAVGPFDTEEDAARAWLAARS